MQLYYYFQNSKSTKSNYLISGIANSPKIHRMENFHGNTFYLALQISNICYIFLSATFSMRHLLSAKVFYHTILTSDYLLFICVLFMYLSCLEMQSCPLCQVTGWTSRCLWCNTIYLRVTGTGPGQVHRRLLCPPRGQGRGSLGAKCKVIQP